MTDISSLPHTTGSRAVSDNDTANADTSGMNIPVSLSLVSSVNQFLEEATFLPEFYHMSPTGSGSIIMEYESGKCDYGLEFHDDGRMDFIVATNDHEHCFSETYERDEIATVMKRVMMTG